MEHKRNKNIQFNKEKHLYFHKTKGVFQGITSWISQYAEPFDVNKISKKVAYIRGVEQEQILQEWKDARLYGDYVHETIENYITLGQGLDVGCLKLFKAKLKEFKLTPISCEWVVYDESINRASAIDVVCENENGKIVIVDLKTMAKPIKYNGYRGKTMYEPISHLPDAKYFKQSLQVNIYRKWLNDLYKVDLAPTHYIMRLRDDICEMIPVIDLEKEIESLYCEIANE